MAEKRNLLIVDDHPVVLAGLQHLIMNEGIYDKIFSAADIEGARKMAMQTNISVAIIDLELGEENGIQLIRLLRQVSPQVKVVVYTMHEELWTIRQLMNVNADAVVMKGDNPKELLTALHMIEEGRGYFSQQFVRLINRQPAEGQVSLSERELEVLEHISNGLSTSDIAQRLNISSNTIEYHRHNLMKKLQASNVAQMVRKAMQMGLRFMRC